MKDSLLNRIRNGHDQYETPRQVAYDNRNIVEIGDVDVHMQRYSRILIGHSNQQAIDERYVQTPIHDYQTRVYETFKDVRDEYLTAPYPTEIPAIVNSLVAPDLLIEIEAARRSS